MDTLSQTRRQITESHQRIFFLFVDLNERPNLIQSTIWIKSDGHFYTVGYTTIYPEDLSVLQINIIKVIVYYFVIKRELNRRPMYEYRCDERLKASRGIYTPRIHWVARVEVENSGKKNAGRWKLREKKSTNISTDKCESWRWSINTLCWVCWQRWCHVQLRTRE